MNLARGQSPYLLHGLARPHIWWLNMVVVLKGLGRRKSANVSSTPSDTIDAEACKNMGTHLSLSTDIPVRYILAAQPRSQRCFGATLKISRLLGRSLDTCQCLGPFFLSVFVLERSQQVPLIFRSYSKLTSQHMPNC